MPSGTRLAEHIGADRWRLTKSGQQVLGLFREILSGGPGHGFYGLVGMTDWANLIVGLFGGVAGSLLEVFGLFRWLGDLWLGRILEQEKAKYTKELEQLRANFAQALEGYKDELARSKTLLQAEIDRAVFVTRADFETEFEAYKQVFAALAEVRLTMAGMRPMLSVSNPDETEEDRRNNLAKRLRALMDAYDKVVTLVENLGPFYPQELYSVLLDCLGAAHLEILLIRTSGLTMFTPQWYEQGQKQMDKFTDAYSRVSNIIRERIASLTIVPRG